ncbi:tRNA (carboxymethyluridine(34)-5-O)-methyltransferase ALKBH8 [Calliopsis andreniformis]|uniref:tRNA (carboxymethyluridine(34)-5-O)-methyltransferase ALKBH8 n=1 Tax=Calliopsis andreniformis TaxID=337506 RepID=UPI003FCEAC02
MDKKLIKKSYRKQKRAYHRLYRDLNIKCCDNPTEFVMICNAGLATGLQRDSLENIINPLISRYKIIMLPNKSYCFIKFDSVEDAIRIYNLIHGCIHINGQNTLLYASFTESVPDVSQQIFAYIPPGFRLIENIITEEEEKILLNTINWNYKDSSDLKNRKVKHYGYEFLYNSNTVDLDKPIAPIPQDYQFLQALFKKYHDVPYEYDQLTINRYLPGQGIPSHIDTHSVFEDSILSLSLGSQCVMDFKQVDKKISITLPPRSLLIMSGEARYAWSHGICSRHSDIIETENEITIQPREIRTSLTFRKVRRGACCCTFPDYCDTKQNYATKAINNEIAIGIEHSYVHEVYDQISNHFDETRHKQWPNVSKFLSSLSPGDILLDVGCGNGKYLHDGKNIFKVGCDRSQNLIKICHSKGFEVFLSDCLYLPYKDESIDAAISIAVIHHLSTHERRKQAITELARILRINGKCLIYVWAKEQDRNCTQTAYLKYNLNKKENKSLCTQKLRKYNIELPVHENRTKFTYTDMLVPWKRKGGGNFLRYYHVFEENELLQLCLEVSAFRVEEQYYDQGNWCIILQKR